MEEKSPHPPYHYFLLLWLGQFISNFGTALTGFAIGVWVYQETGSASKLSFTLLSSSLPGVLAAPLIGALIDRHDRRKVLIVGNAGAMLGIAVLAALFLLGEPGIVTICLLLAFATVFRTSQWPAFSALISFLVEENRLAKANGLVEVGRAVSEIGAPILAGYLLLHFRVAEILVLDALTYAVSLTILFALSFRDVAERKGRRKTLAGEAWEGFLYVYHRHGLWTLLLLFSALNFLSGILQVLLTPFVLHLGDARDLGWISGIAGGGMLVGGLVITTWGAPRRKIPWILSLMAMQGAALAILGVLPGLITVAAAMFVFMAAIPIINGMSQVIWQTAVERSYQGRIFAIRRTIATATFPLAYLLSGPLTDYFSALFASPNAPSNILGGNLPAEAQGLGLLYAVLGGAALLLVLVGASRKTLREIDDAPPKPPNEEITKR